MKFKTVFLGMTICILLFGNWSYALSLPGNVRNYFWSYQPGLLEEMKKFDMVITDTRIYSKEEIMQLKEKKTTVIGYVSIGESDQMEKGDGLGPGGYASWYFDSNNDGLPDQNKECGSYYTNAGNSRWVQKIIKEEIKKVLDSGADGFFLDTVDTSVLYPQTEDAMTKLIKNIRDSYPDKIIIQNWGFGIVDSTVPYINAVMWESWYPDSDNQWIINWQNRFKELKSKYGVDLIALGYYEKYSNLERYYEVSKKLGFIPFISSKKKLNEVADFFSAREVILNPVSELQDKQPAEEPQAEQLAVVSQDEQPTEKRVVFLKQYEAARVILAGLMSGIIGWIAAKSYYGKIHRKNEVERQELLQTYQGM